MNHVWYASYGSNLAEHRFSCYLNGGSPSEMRHVLSGARDASPTTGATWFWCEHELYFAEHSQKWGGGVAFIDPRLGGGRSLLRLRRLTVEQFEDVMAQENGLVPGELKIAGLPAAGESLALSDRWYGTVVGLADWLSPDGDREAVVTFTNAGVLRESRPSASYLGTILRGLAAFSEPLDSIDYLLGLRGVRGHWTREGLLTLAESLDSTFK